MTYPSKPIVGTSVGPYIADVDLWSILLDMTADYRAGEFTKQGQRGGYSASIGIRNLDGDPIPLGEIRQLDALVNQDTVFGTGDVVFENTNPVFDVIDPVWHTDIDNVVVIHRSTLQDITPVRGARVVVVPITSPPSSPAANKSGWVMIDPDTPTRLKWCETSGIYRALGIYNPPDHSPGDDPFVILDTQESQNLWRYQMTQASQAPSDTTASLLDLEGNVFATTINLSDPTELMRDQGSGDIGWCLHKGNKFYAIQAPC